MNISEEKAKILALMLFLITLIGLFYYWVEYRLPTLENNQVEKEK